MKTQAATLLFCISSFVLPAVLLGAEHGSSSSGDEHAYYLNPEAVSDAESEEVAVAGRAFFRPIDAPVVEVSGDGDEAAPVAGFRSDLTEALYALSDQMERIIFIEAGQIPELAKAYPRLRAWPVRRGKEAFVRVLPDACRYCEKKIEFAAALFDTLREGNQIVCAGCVDPGVFQVARNPALVLFQTPEEAATSRGYEDKVPMLSDDRSIVAHVSDI